jgi:hypothetical protein
MLGSTLVQVEKGNESHLVEGKKQLRMIVCLFTTLSFESKTCKNLLGCKKKKPP